MSGFRIILVLLSLFIFSYAQTIEKKPEEIKYTQKQIEEFKAKYHLAVEMFNRGDYYSALNLLSKIIRYPKNPYYADALKLSAKIYLIIGRKTGIKEFLQKALYYINTYSSVAKNPYNWDFYYTKGNIYENLFMYERALALYKLAFAQAKTQKQQFKTVIAILRTAAWLKRLDIITRYIVLVNLEELSEKEKKEFEFVKGLVEFQKGNYQEAFKYLIPVYKEYEQYLIENPVYYYILGENAYRLKKYTFAKQVFRRIISIVKDESIIRKSLLRLGDIAHYEGDDIQAFNYYYTVIKKYPESKEAIIAKLKILALADFNPEIKKKLALIEDEDIKNPFEFVLKTLISNRNNYVGFFALGNFGEIVLSKNSDKLFKKLTWELSLVNTNRLKYEHKEYINQLWKDKIEKLPPIKICDLFISNEDFFFKVFDRDVLKLVYQDLKKCGKYLLALKVAKFMYKKYRDDDSLLILADTYYSLKNYKKSLEILQKVKNKNCEYYLLQAKNLIFLDKFNQIDITQIENSCKDNPEKYLILGYIYLKNNQIDKLNQIIDKLNNKIPQIYENSLLARIFVREMVYALFEKDMYQTTLKVLLPLSERFKEDCDINSWVVIALIRSNRTEKLNQYTDRINNCNTEWSIVAKNLIEDYQLIRGFKNE